MSPSRAAADDYELKTELLIIRRHAFGTCQTARWWDTAARKRKQLNNEAEQERRQAEANRALVEERPIEKNE